MGVHWVDKDKLFQVASGRFVPADIVLDIGCGIRPQQYVRPLVHICCDPFNEYVEHLKETTGKEYDRSYVILQTSWAEAVRMFPPKSVDSVFLVDVIEHLEKEEAERLLKSTESIARKQVAVFTPIGFLPQCPTGGKDAWGLGGGAWQEHKSGWLPEDFGESWDVYAAREFHVFDHAKAVFETPYGAMWAVKTFDEADGKFGAVRVRKDRIRSIHGMAVDIDDFRTLEKVDALLGIVENIRDEKLFDRINVLTGLASDIGREEPLDMVIALMRAILKVKRSKSYRYIRKNLVAGKSGSS